MASPLYSSPSTVEEILEHNEFSYGGSTVLVANSNDDGSNSLDSGLSSMRDSQISDLDQLDVCDSPHTIATTALYHSNNFGDGDLTLSTSEKSSIKKSKILKLCSTLVTILIVLFLSAANTTELISFSNIQKSHNVQGQDFKKIETSNDCTCNISESMLLNISRDKARVWNSEFIENVSRCVYFKQVTIDSYNEYELRATLCQYDTKDVFVDIREYEHGIPTHNGFYVNQRGWFNFFTNYIEFIEDVIKLIHK